MALISSPGHYADVDDFNKAILGEDQTCLEAGGLFSPSSVNSNAFSLIDFKSESVLSFEQSDEQAASHNTSSSKIHGNHKADPYYSMWEGHFSQKCSTDDPRLLDELGNCFQTASNYSSITNTTTKDSQQGDHGTYGWLYSEATVVSDCIHESGTHQTLFHKRAHTVIFFNFALQLLNWNDVG